MIISSVKWAHYLPAFNHLMYRVHNSVTVAGMQLGKNLRRSPTVNRKRVVCFSILPVMLTIITCFGSLLLFLLLRSQPYLWGSPFLVRFLCMWPVFNPSIEVATFCLHGWDRLVGLVVKASASRAEGPRFESRLSRDFFGVESYRWLKNWHSSGYPARRLAL